MSWPKNYISVANLDTCNMSLIITGIPGWDQRVGPCEIPPLMDRPVYKLGELPVLQDSNTINEQQQGKKSKASPHLQIAPSWEVNHALMSSHFPRGLSDKLPGLLLCADIFQVTVQEAHIWPNSPQQFLHDNADKKATWWRLSVLLIFVFALDLHIPDVGASAHTRV